MLCYATKLFNKGQNVQSVSIRKSFNMVRMVSAWLRAFNLPQHTRQNGANY